MKKKEQNWLKSIRLRLAACFRSERLKFRAFKLCMERKEKDERSSSANHANRGESVSMIKFSPTFLSNEFNRRIELFGLHYAQLY